VHVLHKNHDDKSMNKLITLSVEYINKLIAAKVLDIKSLPMSKKIMLNLFRKKIFLPIVTIFCKL